MHKNGSKNNFSLSIDEESSSFLEREAPPPPTAHPGQAYRELPEDTPESTSKKDFQVTNYQPESDQQESSGDDKSLEFINRAQYDLEKLMESSNGEWRPDSDIIKESLTHYQLKKRAAETQNLVARDTDTSQATKKRESKQQPVPRVVIDEFDEDDSRTHSRRGTGYGSKRQSTRERSAQGQEQQMRTVPNDRNSMRVSQLTFGKKASKGSLRRLNQVTVKSKAGELRRLVQAQPVNVAPVMISKENQKPNFGPDERQRIGALESRHLSRGKRGSSFNSIFYRFQGRLPPIPCVFGKRKTPLETPLSGLARVASELGLDQNAGTADVVLEIRKLKRKIKDLEMMIGKQATRGDFFSIRVDNEGDPVTGGSEMIDLYNRNRSKPNMSGSQGNSGFLAPKRAFSNRNSLSSNNKPKIKVSEYSNYSKRDQRNDSNAGSSLESMREQKIDRPKVFGRLSKLVSLSRSSCHGSLH